MSLIHETDYGTPASKSSDIVELTIDGAQGQRAGRHVDHARGDGPSATKSRNSAPPIASTHSAPAAFVLSRSKAATARPPLARHRSRPAWSSIRRRRALKALRNGVMELYISDHPLDCLTCAANGNCELQTQAGVVGLREVRYGYEGENPPEEHQGHIQSLFSPMTRRNASSAIAASAPAKRCKARSR